MLFKNKLFYEKDITYEYGEETAGSRAIEEPAWQFLQENTSWYRIMNTYKKVEMTKEKGPVNRCIEYLLDVDEKDFRLNSYSTMFAITGWPLLLWGQVSFFLNTGLKSITFKAEALYSAFPAPLKYNLLTFQF